MGSEEVVLYRGMVAQYWDLLRGDTSGWSSRPYFLAVIRQSGEPVLDVACGTGRLLLDYRREGVDIDGVDISPDMVEQCRQNARQAGLPVSLYVQSMQALDLPRRYRTIIVPSSSFLHLTGREDARGALKRFRAHLAPGGQLAMSMRVFEPDPTAEQWELVEHAVRPGDGAEVQHWFRCTYDVPRQLQHTEDRYDVVLDGTVLESQSFAASPCMTWYSVTQAIALLVETGFGEVKCHADFTVEPAADGETSFIVLGRRPAAV